MSKCVLVQRNHRKLCSGDLTEAIRVLERTIIAPLGGEEDYTVDVDTDTADVIFASIRTVKGISIFDGTDTEVDISHIFGVYFDESFTSEDVVLFDQRYFRILRVEDLEERHEWMFLYAHERGTVDNPVNTT